MVVWFVGKYMYMYIYRLKKLTIRFFSSNSFIRIFLLLPLFCMDISYHLLWLISWPFMQCIKNCNTIEPLQMLLKPSQDGSVFWNLIIFFKTEPKSKKKLPNINFNFTIQNLHLSLTALSCNCSGFIAPLLGGQRPVHLKPAWIFLLVMDFSQATLNTSKKCSFAKAFVPCF